MVKILALDLLGSLIGNQSELNVVLADSIGSVVKIQDSRGRTLMIAKETGSKDAVVIRNGRLFGTIEGVANKINLPETFRAVNAHGECMFEVERGTSKMQFFSGGSVIGTTSVAELPFDLNSLKFSSELDVNTKAMMVATTCHVVFLLNYEITRDRVKCGWLPKLVFYAFIFFFVGSLVFVMTRPCQMEEVKLLDEQRAGNATSGLETHNFSIFRMGFGK